MRTKEYPSATRMFPSSTGMSAGLKPEMPDLAVLTIAAASKMRKTTARMRIAYFRPLLNLLSDEVRLLTPRPGRSRKSFEMLLWLTQWYTLISGSLETPRGSSTNLYRSAQRANSRRKTNCQIITAIMSMTIEYEYAVKFFASP